MPAGQVYRLTRVQRQQQRQFDPNLLGLQLTDQPTVDLVPENPGTGYLRRYQGRQQWSQWPTLSRLDATGLERADQPDIDLEPWTPPTAAYQRYRGKPQQAQWPTYARMQATDLQLVDETALNTVPEWMPPWYRGRAPVSQWRQFEPVDLTPFVTGLPDQDINLVPSWAAGSPIYALRRSRAANQQAVVTDPSTLELADQDVTLLPVVRLWRRPPTATQWRQPTYFDATFIPSEQDVNLVPVFGLWRRPPSRASYQQAVYFDLGGLGLIDQDVNLVPVSARMWRPPSRAPYQQADYFDLGGLGLQLADQDVNLVPIDAAPPRGVRSLAAQWHQQAFSDPAFLTPALPDQDVNLVTLWASRAAVYAIRKGHQQWQQYTPFDLSQIPVAQDVNLVPSWMAANTWLARRAGRPTWQQFTPTDPTALELVDEDINLIPSWAALMGGILARRFGRSERLQPVYYDLAGLSLQLTDQDVRLVPAVAPRSTYLRYQGRQQWLVRVVYPSTDIVVVVPDLHPIIWIWREAGALHFTESGLLYVEAKPLEATEEATLRGRDLWITYGETP